MILYKMTASFGKLDGSLELHDGMNIIELPNEGGKSTWSAFLLAMLYGIDTRERSSAANEGLPAKERYRPWSGKPMEGSIELNWNGRRITIERKTGPRGPMSMFHAYDTDSGNPVSELTAENCGLRLCGVERSVFERSAFIRQLGLSVSADDALEQRLRALITTGEEHSKSAAQLEKELRSLKNRLSGKGGRIATAGMKLAELESRKESLQRTKEQHQAAIGEQIRLQKELDALEEKIRRVEQAKIVHRGQGLRDFSEKQAEQEERCRNLKQMVDQLPPEDKLLRLQKELKQAEQQFQSACMDRAFQPVPTPPPPVPPCFVKAVDPEKQVAEDLSRYDLYARRKKPSALWLLLWLPMLLCGGAGIPLLWMGVFLQPRFWPISAAIATLGLVGTAVHWIRSRRAKHATETMQAIASRYHSKTRQEIEDFLKLYLQMQQAYAAQHSVEQRRQALLDDTVGRAQGSLDEVIRQVARFAPEAVNVNEAKRAISAALLVHSSYATERRFLEQQRAGMRGMRNLLDALPAQDEEALRWDEGQLRHEKEMVTRQLRNATDRVAELRTKAEALGDWVELSAAVDYLKEQLRKDEETEAALLLAQEALQEAAEEMRSRFSPPIAAEASRILAQLTGGTYSSLLLDVEMRLSLRENGLTRPAAAMSCGTTDQMYLALRLAMCRLLLPKGVPLLLDDTLVNFDPKRSAAAIDLLKQEERQILLFTCRPLF